MRVFIDPVIALQIAVQTVTEGAYAQVVVAMVDERRRSPTSSDVAKGLFEAEKLGHSFVSLTSLCDAVGAFLIGDECNPCPSGATCPGAHFACFGRYYHVPTSVASQEEAESGPTKASGTEAKCPALFQDAPPPSGARAGDSRGVLLATKGTTALSSAPSTTLHTFAGVSKPTQQRGVSQVLCA